MNISVTIARTAGNVSAGSASVPHPFALQEGVRDGGEHHVMVPAGIRAPFEMIETELGFEFLVLLFDRPPLMGEAHQLRERGSRRQVDEEVLDTRRQAQVLFAQEPDLGRESAVAPLVGRGHAQRPRTAPPTDGWCHCARSRGATLAPAAPTPPPAR